MVDEHVVTQKLKEIVRRIGRARAIDPRQIHAVATAGLGDLERFAAEVGAWIEGRGDAGG